MRTRYNQTSWLTLSWRVWRIKLGQEVSVHSAYTSYSYNAEKYWSAVIYSLMAIISNLGMMSECCC